MALGDGTATLTLKANSVLGKVVTVVYSGDRNFQPSQVITPVLTRGSLRSLARPMFALVKRLSS